MAISKFERYADYQSWEYDWLHTIDLFGVGQHHLMREFVFTIEYEQGADPVMDVFIEHPNTRAQTIACHVSKNGLWRLDQITGSETALTQLDDIFTDPVHCNECICERHCHTNWDYEILMKSPSCRLVYTYRPTASDCWSIPHLASCYLGDGLICDAERRKDRYEWRLLLCGDASVSELYEVLQAELREGLRLGFQQVGEPSYWIDEAITLTDLPHEQWAAIEAAVEHGYYQTPRDISLTDLAKTMDLPLSTLQYRLQQAEAWVIQCFVTQSPTSGG
ncbi:helix-turn-helix domain-containing protein [Haladaptatus halobius]|uniref:helix-turn-helix domain-containing protein n=1 Tax=Haladaptatus halobius TaxID=2884875 RepID=UPI001D0B2B5C|nr:helix-turn-helix domain-containing protein [Haladaptatus halobius]